jgi:hypothetical protein
MFSPSVVQIILILGRRVLGQSLKHWCHKGDAVGETKKSRADSEQLALR